MLVGKELYTKSSRYGLLSLREQFKAYRACDGTQGDCTLRPVHGRLRDEWFAK